ncbi:hypothetical protein DUNSADRAFT_15479 [Dunaliella salina]|uniref:Uncharacterized protein n=1 Tax=Dunaliella salina TaxID=3046 RepID=A0ABQ7G5F8_DUNSA|nr:hypothetical protein DUNSADRAFT_15479 [Dunaliella salina]|eukprot:KAF5829797.1 hypothetical protein DUNSADRAFT_15479 [Dunaliella salina]
MCAQDLDELAATRDKALQAGSENQLSAFVLANTKKEKVGLERMMIIESSIRDIATATARAMAQLQVKVDKGVADVGLMVESARETTQEREGALREQVNESLAKIRAYARDMEEALERERLSLEEVVKLEIKGRMASVEGLRGEIQSTNQTVKESLAGCRRWQMPILVPQTVRKLNGILLVPESLKALLVFETSKTLRTSVMTSLKRGGKVSQRLDFTSAQVFMHLVASVPEPRPQELSHCQILCLCRDVCRV